MVAIMDFSVMGFLAYYNTVYKCPVSMVTYKVSIDTSIHSHTWQRFRGGCNCVQPAAICLLDSVYKNALGKEDLAAFGKVKKIREGSMHLANDLFPDGSWSACAS